MRKRKLILRSHFSLGDIVLMTAAVRDLHRCYPGQFRTDVRTSCGELWDHNPHIERLDEGARGVEEIKIGYPLIDFSNHSPYHAVHGYVDDLNAKLGLEVRATEFKGDIHLSQAEGAMLSPVAELVGAEFPYWIIVAGGKFDVTIKWWDSDRYQEVVDRLRDRVTFVQVGQNGDHHPKLNGVVDLRGKLNTRQLIRLVHHSQGVLCGVTGIMHLAAAVPLKDESAPLRPCVVVAGGREPTHWEAYPNHQFIHTIGALPCCARGGCWKARVFPLGDGDERDGKDQLCRDVVKGLPKCMEMISAAEVVRRIETYFDGGSIPLLSSHHRRLAAKAVSATQWNQFDAQQLTPSLARSALERAAKALPDYPGGFSGRGIVICAGGVKYFTNAWVCIQMLRKLGCRLPIQLWHLGPEEMDARMKALVAPLGVTCIDALALRKRHPSRLLHGWQLKPYALIHCPYREVLLLDADNVPVMDPEFLFKTPEYHDTGAIFWPDFEMSKMKAAAWALCGLPEKKERAFETGQIVIDKRRSWKPLRLAMWFNEHSDFWYAHTIGDKETFHLAWRKLGIHFAMPRRSPNHRMFPKEFRGVMRQYDFQNRLLFQHRNTDKWSIDTANKKLTGFRFEKECREFLNQLRKVWDMKIDEPRIPRPSKERKEIPHTNGRLKTRHLKTLGEERNGKALPTLLARA